MNGNQQYTDKQIDAAIRQHEEDARTLGPNRKARRAAGIEAVPAWTRCDQRTPPIGQAVLGYLRGGFGVYRYRGTEDGCQVWYDQNEYLIDDPDEGNPTHWMSLPDKPRKGDKQMPACEKCWNDAMGDMDKYSQLVRSRLCPPEEQAGKEATICPQCSRRTVHQYARICMVCFRKFDPP